MIPTGDRYRLRHGGYTAEIVQCGASLRVLRAGDRDLVLPFDPERPRPDMRGAIMQPWTGRIHDGRYGFAGRDHQLALTEPTTRSALHGLVHSLAYEAVDATADRIELAALLLPQTGYPFVLRSSVRYVLGDDGLRITITGENAGDGPLPYAAGFHPYLVGGAGSVDRWSLTLDADASASSDLPRYATRPAVSVADTGFDVRTGARVGGRRLNHTYSELARDADGWSSATVLAADRSGVRIRWDRSANWVQVFSYDLPGEAARTGLAVEPMTAPLNAFVTGDGLIVLDPGERHELEMIIEAVDRREPSASGAGRSMT